MNVGTEVEKVAKNKSTRNIAKQTKRKNEEINTELLPLLWCTFIHCENTIIVHLAAKLCFSPKVCMGIDGAHNSSRVYNIG